MAQLTRLITLRESLLIASGAILFASAALLLYPEILSLSSRVLETESDSLEVRGVYWTLPLASVDSLTLVSNELTIKGKYLPFIRHSRLRQITRAIPPKLRAAELYPDRGWTTWFEGDVIRNIIGHSGFWRSVSNLHTHSRFSFAIPFKDYYQILKFYHGSGDTSVAIFAFGKHGQDEQSLMGYILITNRVPK